jgi:hypothetical protein
LLEKAREEARLGPHVVPDVHVERRSKFSEKELDRVRHWWTENSRASASYTEPKRFKPNPYKGSWDFIRDKSGEAERVALRWYTTSIDELYKRYVSDICAEWAASDSATRSEHPCAVHRTLFGYLKPHEVRFDNREFSCMCGVCMLIRYMLDTFRQLLREVKGKHPEGCMCGEEREEYPVHAGEFLRNHVLCKATGPAAEALAEAIASTVAEKKKAEGDRVGEGEGEAAEDAEEKPDTAVDAEEADRLGMLVCSLRLAHSPSSPTIAHLHSRHSPRA